MAASQASNNTEETVLSIVDTDYDDDDDDDEQEDDKKKQKEEEEEEENTDCRVYITTGLLVVLCVIVVFGKVAWHWHARIFVLKYAIYIIPL